MFGKAEASLQLPYGIFHGSVLEATLIPELKDPLMERVQSALHRSRAAMYREATRVVDQESSEIRRKTLASIAETLEFIAQAYDEQKDRELLWGKVLNLILAGLAYEGAGSPANAQLLIQRAIRTWENTKVKQIDADDPISILESRAFACALALLRKDPYSARSISEGILEELATLEEAAVARFNERDYARADLEHFVGQTLLVRGFASFSEHLLGLDSGTLPDLGYFDDARAIYEHLGNSMYWLLAQLMGLALREAAPASTAFTLPRFFTGHEERRYVASLLSEQRRIFQLWPSQLQAIRQGVFDVDTTRVALSLPTSAGKTLIAESAIARELLKDPGARCIYLAPTRALVSEVERTLKRSLKPLGIEVSQISAAPELSTIETEVALENRLLGLTPEKLDVFLRLGHEILVLQRHFTLLRHFGSSRSQPSATMPLEGAFAM